MAKKENKEIKEAVKTYEVLTGDAEVKRLEEVRMMSRLEEQSALECAKKEKQVEIAKKLLELKIPVEQIMEATELTEEEIKKIK